jgi:plastocyanin
MRRFVVAAALVPVLLTSACSNGGGSAVAPTRAGATVELVLTEFAKTDVTIEAGQALTFVNANPITHVIVPGTFTVGMDGLRTAETVDGAFTLTLSKKGQQAEHVFDTAGTFQFFCTIHKGMNGTVTVT